MLRVVGEIRGSRGLCRMARYDISNRILCGVSLFRVVLMKGDDVAGMNGISSSCKT